MSKKKINASQNPTLPLKTKIRETLLRLGAVNDVDVEVFARRTRDKEQLLVFRDKVRKIIFIDDYYVGEEEYADGQYRKDLVSTKKVSEPAFEDIVDSQRRFDAYHKFIVSKDICDFGCGKGSFLRLSKSVAKKLSAVELQRDFSDALNGEGIACHSSIEDIIDEQDSVFLFHCLEHLPDPASILSSIHKKLKKDGVGKIIVEVPHARDFLIDKLPVSAFIDFTLWSQHLLLHTRESLQLLLADAGFKNITIEGIQRFSLANHFQWLSQGTPGGHRSVLSVFETDSVINSYAAALSKIDSNDTLVAIATT